MENDIIGLLNPMIQVIYAASFALMYVFGGRQRTVLAFAVGNSVAILAFMLKVYWQSPIELVNQVVAHLMLCGCAMLMCWALCKRVGQQVDWPVYAGIVAIGSALTFTASANGSMIGEVIASSLTYGCLYLVTALTMRRAIARHFLDDVLYWLVLLVMAGHNFVRPVLMTIFEPQLTSATYLDSQYLAGSIVVVAISTIMVSTAAIAAFLVDQFRARYALAETDELSGVLIRRTFEHRAIEMLERAQAKGTDVSCIVVDIDNFKQVNDIFGHQAGDQVIAGLGHLLSDTVRPTDIVGRVGGEEFCIVVWKCEEEMAANLAERIRQSFARIEFAALGTDMRVTASFGVSAWKSGEAYTKLFGRADDALYKAKERGRNRVATHRMLSEPPQATSGSDHPEPQAA